MKYKLISNLVDFALPYTFESISVLKAAQHVFNTHFPDIELFARCTDHLWQSLYDTARTPTDNFGDTWIGGEVCRPSAMLLSLYLTEIGFDAMYHICPKHPYGTDHAIVVVYPKGSNDSVEPIVVCSGWRSLIGLSAIQRMDRFLDFGKYDYEYLRNHDLYQSNPFEKFVFETMGPVLVCPFSKLEALDDHISKLAQKEYPGFTPHRLADYYTLPDKRNAFSTTLSEVRQGKKYRQDMMIELRKADPKSAEYSMVVVTSYADRLINTNWKNVLRKNDYYLSQRLEYINDVEDGLG